MALKPPADTGLHTGPTIVVTRAVPVRITVVNTRNVTTSVHWHGIELESYFDGVAGCSGAGAHLAPIIAPHDSFVVRFTPPRAGTFIYHTLCGWNSSTARRTRRPPHRTRPG